MNDSVVTFKHIECSRMSEEEIRATSKLFSENYGKWSNCFPDVGKRGQIIKYPPNKIKRDFVDKPDRFVIMAFVNNNPAVPQALFIIFCNCGSCGVNVILYSKKNCL